MDGRTIDLSENVTPSIVFLVFYAIIFLGLLLGRAQFRVKATEAAS